MIAPLAKFLDWSAIQVLTMMLPPFNAQKPRLEEALEFLNGPEFIPAESQPARVQFDGPLHFHFPTPRPCDFAENNIVYGRLYRCGDRWQERPMIILLHGGGGFPDHQIRFPLIARRCNRAGFNAATLVAPYHLQRRPQKRGALNSLDCFQFAKATAQVVAETRALAGWLLGEGCPTVSLWGYSYGGWHGGMAACRDTRLAAVVMAVPGVRMNALEQRAIWPSVRRRLQRVREICERLNLTALNLTTIQPAIPKDNILFVEGIHDLLAPKENVEDLWQTWGHPDIWRLPLGHTSLGAMAMPGLDDRILRWLEPRLNNNAVQAQNK